jgi:hypothetical protein
MQPTTISLSDAELVDLTGYVRPADQLKRLHALGFRLAWRNLKSGRCVLPRAHYEAVCRGEPQAQQQPAARPQLTPGKWQQQGRRLAAT